MLQNFIYENERVLLDDEIKGREYTLNMNGKKRYRIELNAALRDADGHTYLCTQDYKELTSNLDLTADTFDDALKVAYGLFMKLMEYDDLYREIDSPRRYMSDNRGGIDNYNRFCELSFSILDDAGNDEYHIDMRKWIDFYLFQRSMQM